MRDERDILVIDDCECGCGCNEVELHSDHQPEVLLFDEYGELYENDIIETRSLVERIWDFIQDKYATIVDKLNDILSDTSDIRGGLATAIEDIADAKSDLHRDILSEADGVKNVVNEKAGFIRQDAFTYKNAILESVAGKATSINDNIDASTAAIRHDIADISSSQLLEECSEQDIYDMFESES